MRKITHFRPQMMMKMMMNGASMETWTLKPRIQSATEKYLLLLECKSFCPSLYPSFYRLYLECQKSYQRLMSPKMAGSEKLILTDVYYCVYCV